jgi:hypothetical protein
MPFLRSSSLGTERLKLNTKIMKPTKDSSPTTISMAMASFVGAMGPRMKAIGKMIMLSEKEYSRKTVPFIRDTLKMMNCLEDITLRLIKMKHMRENLKIKNMKVMEDLRNVVCMYMKVVLSIT